MQMATMNRVEAVPAAAHPAARNRLAHDRAVTARASLADCQLCAHHCGVNRLAGEEGLCHADAVPHVFHAQMEVADELELIPSFAIAVGGCDLRCAFCITGERSWNAKAGEPLTAATVAARAEAALARGARSITFLGGEVTIHLPYALEVVAELPDTAKLVWKTNGHGSFLSRAFLFGIFDVWCVDFKFGNDACAERLARVPNYRQTVRENLLWAARQSDLIVRHVLMPGHVDCCWAPVAAWLAAHLPGVKVNLRSGFWPGWQSHRHPELRQPPTGPEIRRAWTLAEECGLNLIE